MEAQAGFSDIGDSVTRVEHLLREQKQLEEKGQVCAQYCVPADHLDVSLSLLFCDTYSLLMGHYFKLWNSDPNFQKPRLFKFSSSVLLPGNLESVEIPAFQTKTS